jgi:predicted XRE-type DNA-binding protein
MHKRRYREFIERIASTVEYKVDVAALEFVDELVRCMWQARVTQAELARRLGASEPYVSKVLRGDTNFTLATMVKLATAVGQDLRVHLASAGSAVQWFDVIRTAQDQPDWPRIAKTRRYPRAMAAPGGTHAGTPVAA